MTERTWTTKTLARQLVGYLREHSDIGEEDTVSTLLDSLRSSIVEEEVGVSFDILGRVVNEACYLRQ